jgi:hypothetical protein
MRAVDADRAGQERAAPRGSRRDNPTTKRLSARLDAARIIVGRAHSFKLIGLF